MVRIDFNKVNNTAFQKSVKAVSQNPFATGNFKGHSSPIVDVFVKKGTENIKKEINVIKSLANVKNNVVDKVASFKNTAKTKVVDTANKVAAAILPKTVKAKLLAKKSVADLKTALVNKMSKMA